MTRQDDCRRNIRSRRLLAGGGRRFAAVLIVAVVLVALHRPLLRMCAMPLIVDSAAAETDAVAVAGGDRRYDVAAGLLGHGAADQILLITDRPRWVHLSGAVPPLHRIAQKELRRRGVAASEIVVLGPHTRNSWQFADRIEAWLVQHGERTVMVLVDRFDSHRMWRILTQVIDAELLPRVSVRPLTDRRYDETDWWRSNTGIKALFYGYAALAYACVAGRPQEEVDEWDPDAYEAALRQQLSYTSKEAAKRDRGAAGRPVRQTAPGN